MNIKRLIATSAGAALIFGTLAVPAFAGGHHRHDEGTSVRNSASIRNHVETEANTGDNNIGGREVEDGDIKTGDAEAWLLLENDANSSDLGCACEDDANLKISNRARVRNRVETEANTGDNSIRGGKVEGGLIDTGNAYADSWVTNVVNSTIAGE